MKDKKNDAMLAGGLIAILVPTVLAYCIFTDAIVVQRLWSWFVVPLGICEIGYFHAAGIAVLMAYLSKGRQTKVKKEYREEDNFAVMLFLKPWLVLLIGYVIYRCMS